LSDWASIEISIRIEIAIKKDVCLGKIENSRVLLPDATMR